MGTDMARIGRCAITLFALSLAGGCGATVRPYARDPLLLDRSGVRGDPTRTQDRDLWAGAGPVPPSPPYASSLAAVGQGETVPRAQIFSTSPSGQ